MAQHLTMDQLKAGLPEILKAPADGGSVDAIVIRPKSEERLDVPSCNVSLAGGVEGDHWAKGCWKTTDDGEPHPDVQICIMNSRCINLVAGGERDNWAAAGDNLFVDLDLSPENMPPGQQLEVGTAVLEITDTPHKGCPKFVERYGRDAVVFVNVGEGDAYKLRGIYARVVQDGTIRVGDRLKKI